MQGLLDAGYRQIGMDHFALPDDELSRALDAGCLHRNFQGYTTKPASDSVALGITGIGDLAGAYVQNVKKLPHHAEAVRAGRFPVERGYRLSEDDLIRRHVIQRLMCDFAADIPAVEKQFGIEFAEYFAVELGELKEFESAGFLEIQPQRISLSPEGCVFVRNISMVFDEHLRHKQLTKPVFSRTV